MHTVMLHRFPPDLRTYSAKITRISAATSRIFAYQAHIFYHASTKIAILFFIFFIYFFVEKREFPPHQIVQIIQQRSKEAIFTLFLPPKDIAEKQFLLFLCDIDISSHMFFVQNAFIFKTFHRKSLNEAFYLPERR